MLSNLLLFINMLRRAGIRVGMSEARDFIEALSLAGMDRDGFLWAAEAALIKQESHREVLERVFELFWDKRRPPVERRKARTDRIADAAPRLERVMFQRRLQSLKDYIKREKTRLAGGAGGGCSPDCGGSGRGGGRPGHGTTGKPDPERFASLILGGDPEKMRELARDALKMLPQEEMGDREFLRQMKIITGWAGGEDLLRKMAGGGTAGEMWEVEERLARFGRILAAEKDRMNWEKDPHKVLDSLNLAGASFNSIDYLQAVEIRRRLVMMGRRLATRKGYRYAASPRGKVDLRRTAALAGRHGGVPARLMLRDRQPDRPELVILCDLSGSVASFSRFMLLLVCAMHDKFRLVRSFAFVDAVEEVTHLIRGWDAEKKIAEILRKTRIWQTGFSDYGAVWKQFENSYLEAVGDKTTLIILGDARNNYKPDGLDHFARIAGRARRVVWLNPAPANRWDTEDSIIGSYRPYCAAVLECRNLEQLEKAARHVFN